VVPIKPHHGDKTQMIPSFNGQTARWQRALGLGFLAQFAPAAVFAGDTSVPGHMNIFTPSSTPALQISHLAVLVFVITGAIFLFVAILLGYVIFRYRTRGEESTEPPQVYGSNQIELAWTVIPVLIVIVLFLATARVIFAVQDPVKPRSALDVTVIGHQFWWEFRYPQLGIVTANELHVPVSSASHPAPTYLKLMSADVDHSFWVPQLAGKTDLIPNRVNEMWIDPLHTGLYLGQCAQFCGMEHAKMLLRVYVDTPEQFAEWTRIQQLPGHQDPQAALGRRIFDTESCMNCHTINGTAATGRFGPDLTHLMSRATIASGIAANNRANLVDWIKNPDHLKKGSLMPAMQLSDDQIDAVVAYLSTLQ
jgi:cytochrome c oxidase subunit II